MKDKTVTVFGGTGFIGRYVVNRLAQAGAVVKVVTRHRQSAYFLRPAGTTGQIVPVASIYGGPEEIDRLVQGSDMVVTCLGILSEKGQQTFVRVHQEIPTWIASACARRGVQRLIHISALGIETNAARYALTKLAGEKSVLSAFPAATILRPSLVFGTEDNFFNLFARLAKFAPVLPIFGGGKTRFQPVYVGDVADAVAVALTRPETSGQIYELGGPEILSFRSLLEKISRETRRHRPLISIPWGVARPMAACLGLLPRPPLTNDQITSLQSDSIVGRGAKTLENLGITPTALAVVLPTYLDQYRPGGRFADKKRA